MSAPVQISNWLDADSEYKKNKESIFDLKKEDITYVDSKKLEKVEAKLKQKNEKRENRSSDAPINNAAYDSSKSASASQATNRKAENFKESDSNRSFDVCINNFDVSFGNK